MKYYFQNLHKSIWVNAYKSFPMESCGVIVNNEFIPCKNIADDPYKNFKIDRKVVTQSYVNGLQAVIHSHVNRPYLSKEDMVRGENTDVPWGVAFIEGERKAGIYFWGKGLEVQDLIERPFVYGIYDCYSLVKDFYSVRLNIKLPPVFSDYEWWENGESLFDDLFQEFGFTPIDKNDDYVEGDIFMWAMRSNVVNHIGVYMGNELILHHLNGRLSGPCDVKVWGKSAKYVLRKKERC